MTDRAAVEQKSLRRGFGDVHVRMRYHRRLGIVLRHVASDVAAVSSLDGEGAELKAGIIGLDTVSLLSLLRLLAAPALSAAALRSPLSTLLLLPVLSLPLASPA